VIRCDWCGHLIGARANHLLIATGDVLCGSCINLPLHSTYFPDCTAPWHTHADEHGVIFGDRAGIARPTTVAGAAA
jgi:hypothetical protein